MSRPVFVLFFLASLWLALPADAADEVSEIDFCRDLSLIARDVMTARQKKMPMSETLPNAIKLIEDWAEKYGIEMNSEEIEETAAMLVVPAYDGTAWPRGSLYNEERQDAISDFENQAFEGCYKGAKSGEAEFVGQAEMDAEAEQVPDPELREILRAAREADSFEDPFDAEVWLTDMSARLERQVRDPVERIALLTRVHYEATRVDLPPELILAVIEVKSNFDRFAVSVDGAMGLMQVMPFWRDEIGGPEDNLIHVETNLRYGCTILKFYLDKEEGDLRRALARYDGTLGQRAFPNKVIDNLATKWLEP